jgi:hypothetical protein
MSMATERSRDLGGVHLYAPAPKLVAMAVSISRSSQSRLNLAVDRRIFPRCDRCDIICAVQALSVVLSERRPGPSRAAFPVTWWSGPTTLKAWFLRWIAHTARIWGVHGRTPSALRDSWLERLRRDSVCGAACSRDAVGGSIVPIGDNSLALRRRCAAMKSRMSQTRYRTSLPHFT